jgi:hypothetical protein
VTAHYNSISQGNNPFFFPEPVFGKDPSQDGSVGACPLLLRDVPFENFHAEERYNYAMARGWESKSVEAQQDEAAARTTSEKPRLTREAVARLREKENLRLSLQNVGQQLERSHNPHHRAMLEQARADLERKIQELGA